MTDADQLRLDPDLLRAIRAGVTAAIEHGAEFVAPAHLLLGLLEDARVGPAIDALVPREVIARAAADASKLPEVGELPDETLPEGERAPFPRYDTLAFRALDGSRTLYLDADAYHVFVEGARRVDAEVYRPKHLIYGFTAEAVKDRDLLSLFGTDPAGVAKAVDALP